MINNEELIAVCRSFHIDGEFLKAEVFTDGHINSTYCVSISNGGKIEKYLVQQINNHVFKDIDVLMDNIIGVTKHLINKISENGGDPCRETLHYMQSESGKYYSVINGRYYRIYHFIDNTFTYNIIKNKDIFEDAGRSFGRFQGLLSDYPSESLKETIPNFHHTPKRMGALEKAISEDIVKRADGVRDEIAFALARKDRAGVAISLLESGEIPLRVTHNDTKINNILFDEETKKGICVIDLDTIMPGLSLYDFGDAIRSGASTALEDETDLSKVSVSLELYESYVKGYLDSCAEALTIKEVENLAYGAWLMTFECGCRFLTDYLQNDVYFRTARPNHNLDRARNQFAMVADIEKKLDKMNEITMKAYQEKMAAK